MNTYVPKMRTIKETAKETGLAYNYIRNLCLQNKIVYVRAGNKYLVNIDKLIEFLNTGASAQQAQKLWILILSKTYKNIQSKTMKSIFDYYQNSLCTF